ncbi:MAG TPA: DNA topoisomerase IB, partial [Terriglobia bacterium]|nr:DNA topoisomerase IB [Terriglobia bacterium]
MRSGTNSIATQGAKTAKAIGLTYVSDAAPGFRRIGTKKVFRYLDTKGHVIRNATTLARIQRLAIPPAWTDVWICPTAEGHLQASGRDARGRKQYRYHPQWRETRDETKYHRMVAFGRALPKLRRRVARDLKEKQLTRNKVLATIVRLLETTFIRVGNKEYTKQNDSYGLTTLRNRHVSVRGSQVQFYFRGKSGVKHTIDIENARLAKIVRQLRDLPGYELFQYYDDSGALHAVGSSDVNQYVREATGEDFTAKDFRTWAGTILAAEALERSSEFSSAKQAQKNVKAAIADVADRLGNTVGVCRKSYVHPLVLDAYVEGAFPGKETATAPRGLTARESVVLALLRSRTRPM